MFDRGIKICHLASSSCTANVEPTQDTYKSPYVLSYQGKMCSTDEFILIDYNPPNAYSPYECNLLCIQFGEECKEFRINISDGQCVLYKLGCSNDRLHANYNVYTSISEKVSPVRKANVCAHRSLFNDDKDIRDTCTAINAGPICNAFTNLELIKP